MAAIIDFVKWDTSPEEQLFAWKFPATNLSTYTQLVVAESQEAILFSKGQVIGKFGPGKHTLNTENLPILRTLFGIPFGGKNPFTAEVWFVNKLMPLNLDWTTDSMMYHDPDYQTMVPLLAKGRYGIKIVDAERFLIKLVGTTTTFTASQLTDNFYGATVSKTKSVLLQFIMSNRIGIKSISAFLEGLSDNLRQSIAAYWEDYGFQLISFYITTIEVDSNTDAGKAILKAMSQQSAQIIGGYTWQQSQVFELGDKAVDSMGRGNGQNSLLGAVLATNLMGNMSGGGLLNPVAYNNNQGVNPNIQSPNVTTTRDVYCSNCAKKFSSSNKFCPHCGDPYTPCPRCGADNDTTAKKCVSCGENLTAATPTQTFAITEGSCKRCGFKLGNAAFCPNCGLKNG
ncbi:MAG: SPFH domain-containing protein [Bacteroidetes bacterium]|nr:SPFH domain-containing protein [Bacteroidota bacterium]